MYSRALLAAGSLLALITATPALAQDPPTPPVDPTAQAVNPQIPPAAGDEVIVVTAQLREQRLTEVPVAITAYSGKFLDQLGLHDFEELSRYVPGFEVQNQSPNNPGFVIRGITSDDLSSFVEPRISIFQDGVSIAKASGSFVELYDLERVEVVRGPQSTLYGRGALIGGVNLIQNKANPRGFEAYALGGYGNLDWWMLEGMVNAPLGDDAAVRIAGRLRKRDGYVNNLLDKGGDFNSIDTGAVRGSVRFQPIQRMTFDVIANYQKDKPNGTSFKSKAFNPTDPLTGEVLGNGKPWSGATLAPGAGFEGGRDLGVNREVWGVTGLGRIELNDSLTLNSISAYRKFHGREVLDADGISLPVITAGNDAEGKQASQDLRLTFDNKGPVAAFIGASYFWEKGSRRTPAQFDERTVLAQLTGTLNGGGLIPGRPASDPAPLGLFSNTLFTGALLQGVAAAQGIVLDPDPATAAALAQAIAANLKPGHLETTTDFARTSAIDIYGDAVWHVNDRFDLGAGLRYSHDDKHSGLTSAVLNGRSILGGFLGALTLPDPFRTALLHALAVPGAATIPPSPGFPVPLFGLTFQPTANNGERFDQKLKDHGFTWRLNGRYEIDPRSELYATYSRGRRPEVLSALPPSTPFGDVRFDRIDAETVDNYEIGARHQTHSLYLDGTIYYYRYKNFQTVEQVGTIFVTSNAGKADNYGFEAQARWQPTPNVQLFGTYAFNHGRFRSGVFDGNRFRLSPDHKLSLGSTLRADIGPGRIDFTPSVTYQSKVFFDNNNDRPELQTLATGSLVPDLVQDEVQKGYALVNARLGYTFSERFRIEAFAENLFDKHYIIDAGNTGDALGMPTFIAGAPRTYGVQLSARFR